MGEGVLHFVVEVPQVREIRLATIALTRAPRLNGIERREVGIKCEM